MPINRKIKKYSVPDTFGKRFSKSRKYKGLRQSDLARKLGYSQNSAISDIERDITPVNNSSLLRISEILDVDLHWLITGQPSPYVKSLVSGYSEIVLSLSGLLKNALSDLIQQKIVCYEKRHFLIKEVEKDPDKQVTLDKLNARIEELETAYENAVKAYEQLLNPTFIPPLDDPPDTPNK